MPDRPAHRPAPKLATVRSVELMHAGTWALSSGEATFTGDDLSAAIAALACPAVHKPAIKLGHIDPRFDGEPACGWVDNLRLASAGWSLVGDYTGLPAWLTEEDDEGNSVLASAYPHRSVEGCWDFRCQLGHVHPFVVTAVALLGVAAPGIGTLTSLQDVASLYSGVAAARPPLGGVPVTIPVRASSGHDNGGVLPSGLTVVVNRSGAAESIKESVVPNPQPTMVAAAVSTDDLRSAFNRSAPWSQWITEIQLDPLQLIVCDDVEDEYSRVPVTINGDGTITFGPPVLVEVTYVDVPGGDSDTTTVAARTAARVAGRLVYASRGESRPGEKPTSPPASPSAPPGAPSGPPAPSFATTAPATPPAAAAPAAASSVPAAEPEPTTTPKEDPVSDLSGIRSRLGLPDGADEAAILAALDEKLPTLPSAAPAAPSTSEPTSTPAITPASEPAAVIPAQTGAALPAAEPVAAATQPPSAAAPDPWRDEMKKELASTSQQLAEIRAEKAAEAKRNLFDSAIRAGKIPPAERGAWEARYDKAPEVITDVLAAIADGAAVPVGQGSGYAGAADTDLDAEWAQFAPVFPPAPEPAKGA